MSFLPSVYGWQTPSIRASIPPHTRQLTEYLLKLHPELNQGICSIINLINTAVNKTP